LIVSFLRISLAMIVSWLYWAKCQLDALGVQGMGLGFYSSSGAGSR
jgi:hypothetical protein